jgi:hypothetical protein
MASTETLEDAADRSRCPAFYCAAYSVSHSMRYVVDLHGRTNLEIARGPRRRRAGAASALSLDRHLTHQPGLEAETGLDRPLR